MKPSSAAITQAELPELLQGADFTGVRVADQPMPARFGTRRQSVLSRHTRRVELLRNGLRELRLGYASPVVAAAAAAALASAKSRVTRAES